MARLALRAGSAVMHDVEIKRAQFSANSREAETYVKDWYIIWYCLYESWSIQLTLVIEFQILIP